MEDKSHVGMQQCFFCGEPYQILLDRRLKKSLPRMVCIKGQGCDKCAEYMKMGIMFVSVKDNTDKENPFRTGKMCVIKPEAVERFPISRELKDDFLKFRFGFIEDSVWDALGFPTEDVDNVAKETEDSNREGEAS